MAITNSALIFKFEKWQFTASFKERDALIHKLGKRVPEDVAVAGFDGVEASRWLNHSIASVDQPIEHIAKAAVEMMARRIDNEHLPAERRLFPGRLQPGSSVASRISADSAEIPDANESIRDHN